MQIIEKNNENSYFLNILRVLSCFAIIFLHVQNTAISDDPTVSLALKNNFSFFITNLQWAVPIFFMISGYIFLGIKSECTYKSMFKHYIRLLIVIIFIYTALNIIEYVYIEKLFSLDLLKRSIIKMINGKTWDHLWFIYSIFAIYLVMPVFKLFFDKADENLDIFIIISFIFIYLIPNLNNYLPIKIGYEFVFNWKIFYVFLGGYFAKKKIVNNKINNIIMTILLIIILIINYISYYKYGKALMSYSDRFTVVIFSSLIFLLFMNLFNNKSIIFKKLSKHTFSVYIIHVVFVHMMTKVFHIYPLRSFPILSIILAYIVITIISFLFCIYVYDPIFNIIENKILNKNK